MTKETKVILKELRDEIHRIEKLVNELIVAEEGIIVTEASQSIVTIEKEAEITTFMRELGIPAHLLGYQYIREAVILVLQDEEYIRNITKWLYPAVAKSFKTTPSRVERAIRHAIEVAWQRGNIEKIHKLFGYTVKREMGKSTNTEFIATLAGEIKRQLIERN